MQKHLPAKALIIAALLNPLASFAQGAGGGGSAGIGSSTGGAASGSTAGGASATGSPNAGSGGAGSQGVGGVPRANGLNNSGNNPSGAGNSAKLPAAPGTNTPPERPIHLDPLAPPEKQTDQLPPEWQVAINTATAVILTERQRPASRGLVMRTLNPKIRKVDAKIKSICKGC